MRPAGLSGRVSELSEAAFVEEEDAEFAGRVRRRRGGSGE